VKTTAWRGFFQNDDFGPFLFARFSSTYSGRCGNICNIPYEIFDRFEFTAKIMG